MTTRQRVWIAVVGVVVVATMGCAPAATPEQTGIGGSTPAAVAARAVGNGERLDQLVSKVSDDSKTNSDREDSGGAAESVADVGNGERAAGETKEKSPAATDGAAAATDAKPARSVPRKPGLDAWTLFRGDPASTGVAAGELPDKLSVLWRFKVPDGAFEGTAVIVNKSVYIGDLDGVVYSLSLETGKKAWEYKIDSGFVASTAYRDGLLYVGDIDGRLHCLDADGGKLKWGFDTQASIDSSVNFYQDKVLVGSQDATLYCLDAKTGKQVWKHQIDDQIRCTPTVVGDRAFVAGCDGKLHVIDLQKGEAIAGVNIEAPTGVTPAVRGDFVYFGTEAGAFFSVNWKTAKVQWVYSDPNSSQAYRSSAAVSDSVAVVGSRNRKVRALATKDGSIAWTFTAKQRVDSSPVIVGKRAFFGSADGRLYALDVATGKSVWQYDAGSGFTGSPAVAQGRLVIASDRGVVYCFGKKK